MSDIQNVIEEQNFQVIDGGKQLEDKDTVKMDTLKVFKSKLVSVEYSNVPMILIL